DVPGLAVTGWLTGKSALARLSTSPDRGWLGIPWPASLRSSYTSSSLVTTFSPASCNRRQQPARWSIDPAGTGAMERVAAHCRRRESDELGEESVGLLGEGRPGQVRLIDPQGQHADDGRPEIECDGGGVPWRGNPGVHAALHRGRSARERGLLEGHADLALVH